MLWQRCFISENSKAPTALGGRRRTHWREGEREREGGREREGEREREGGREREREREGERERERGRERRREGETEGEREREKRERERERGRERQREGEREREREREIECMCSGLYEDSLAVLRKLRESGGGNGEVTCARVPPAPRRTFAKPIKNAGRVRKGKLNPTGREGPATNNTDLGSGEVPREVSGGGTRPATHRRSDRDRIQHRTPRRPG